MKTEVLLEHFHRLGDAPDAVPRLRRFILDLAVRGKLVAPAKADEPSAELLKRIDKDLRSRIASGEFKEPKSFIDFAVDGLPFNVPKHWAWVRLITIAEVSYGYAFDSNRFNAQQKGMPLIRIRDISKTDTEAYTDEAYDPFYVVRRGDMLIGMDGDFNIRKWKGNDALLNQRVTRVREWRHGIVDDFMTIPLQMILLHLHGSTSQTTVKHLSAKQLNGVQLPLPPLAEQHRIVAKVDELMALCDRLEAAQQQREQERTRLTAASWQALVQDGTTEAERFALEQLPALTTRPAQVKALRQTILDLAVRGKLVEQDATDEPAEVLLQRVDAERGQLVKSKSIRRQDFLGPIADDAIPYDIPPSWQWRYLADVCFLITDGAHHTPQYLETGVPFLSVKDVSSGEIDFSSARYISVEAHRELCKRCPPERGDILLTKVGTTGIAVTVDDDREFSIFVSLALLKFSQSNLDGRYLKHLINSPFVKQQSADSTQGIGNKNLVLRLINRFTIPIPPLAEQRRIVAKVDALMGLCDRLEAALVEGEALGGRLLEAVLAGGSEDRSIRRPETDKRSYQEPGGELSMAAEP